MLECNYAIIPEFHSSGIYVLHTRADSEIFFGGRGGSTYSFVYAVRDNID